MYVEHLRVQNFRCFSQRSVHLSSGMNVFVGANGQGKTSLIEALYLLLSGESFRTSDLSPLVKSPWTGPEPQFLVEGLVHHGPGQSLQSHIRYALKGRTRSLTLGGKAVTAAKLQMDFPKILFVPESLSAIKGGPEERRNLLDRALVHLYPHKAALPQQFRKALLQKNKLLKMLREGEISAQEGEKTLRSLNTLFLERAFDLTVARQSLLLELLPYIQQAFQTLYSAQASVEISVEYVMSGIDHLRSSEGEVVNAMSQGLKERKDTEVQVGKSLVGPHKHDINFLFNSRDARSYCSQGQQRALILAFQMAQIQRFMEVHGGPPVLLLDDVLSELDLEKQIFLLKYLKGLSTQILITTTDLATIQQLDSDLGQVLDLGQGVEKSTSVSGEEGVRV